MSSERGGAGAGLLLPLHRNKQPCESALQPKAEPRSVVAFVYQFSLSSVAGYFGESKL